MLASPYPRTPENDARWVLSVKAAMKAMNKTDDQDDAVAFYARVFFESDMPTHEPQPTGADGEPTLLD